MTRDELTTLHSPRPWPALVASSVLSALVVLALGLALTWLLAWLGAARTPAATTLSHPPSPVPARAVGPEPTDDGGARWAPPSGHATRPQISP